MDDTKRVSRRLVPNNVRLKEMARARLEEAEQAALWGGWHGRITLEAEVVDGVIQKVESAVRRADK